MVNVYPTNILGLLRQVPYQDVDHTRMYNQNVAKGVKLAFAKQGASNFEYTIIICCISVKCAFEAHAYNSGVNTLVS